MAISSSITPRTFSFAKNQMPLRLSTPDAFTPGELSVYIDVWGAPDTEGDTIVMAWEYNGVEYSVTYTFAAATDPLENEIEVYSGATATDYQQWIDGDLIPGLLANADFNQFFTCTRYSASGFNGVRIYALEPYYAELGLSRTPTGFSLTNVDVTAGSAPTNAEDYAARIKIAIAPEYNSTLNNYTRLPELQSFPNENNEIDIDLSLLVEPYFRDTELPATNSTGIVKHTKSPRKIRVEYGQQYGDPLVRYPVTSIAEFSVLPCGVSNHDWAATPNFQTYLSNSGQQRFFTNRKVQRIYPGQRQWLHWYQGISVNSDLQLRCRAYANGGVTPSTPIPNANEDVESTRVHQMAVHPEALTGDPTDGADYYDLQLVYTDDALIVPQSEIITFKKCPAPTGLTIIAYRNPYGYLETIGLPWSRERIAQVQKQYYEQDLPLEYTTANGRRKYYDEQVIDTFEIEVDGTDTTDAPHLAEVLMSPETYIVANGTRIACNVQEGKMPLEKQYRFGQIFTGQKLTITLDRQISFSRILNLTNLL